jgi:hypothetical protein
MKKSQLEKWEAMEAKRKQARKQARFYKVKLAPFLEIFKREGYVFGILALFYTVLYFDKVFMEFFMKTFIESCTVDWIPCLEDLKKKDVVYSQAMLVLFFLMLYSVENYVIFCLGNLLCFLESLCSKSFFLFCYFYVMFLIDLLIEILASFFGDLCNIDSFWAFLSFTFFVAFLSFSFLKGCFFGFLVYYRNKSKLLILLSKNILLDFHDFSVFHDWPRIFKHTWGSRYVYVEIVDDFITY